MNPPELLQEFWRHKPTGRLWAVELHAGNIIRAIGPLGKEEVDHRVLPYLPYTRRDIRWRPLAGGLGRPAGATRSEPAGGL
ncbi:MAG TPA: hypothetical protein VIE37_15325 [Methylomirabilota bacterium]